MKILITGGAGYIGSHVVYELIDKDNEVVVVDSLWRGFKKNIHKDATFYQCDIRNEKCMDKLFTNEKNIDSIIHFAGSIIVSESIEQPLKYFNNNVYSVTKLLSYAQNNNIKNIVFSSTAAVYGNPQKMPIQEFDKKEPINPYGESKLAAEALIRGWANATNSNYVIFRYFNVVGAHPSKKIGIRGKGLTHLLPCILDVAIGTRTLFEVFGTNYNTKDGSCIRDFIHIQDLVSAHIMGLTWSLKNNKSEIFNLGSGNGYSVLEVLKQVEKTLNTKIPTKLIGRRNGDSAKIYASTQKANKILKWKTQKTLNDMIRDDYEFRKELNKK